MAAIALLAELLDGSGLYGTVLHYSLIIAIVGSAAFYFAYLWYNGRLDMDEEPKWQMMERLEPKESDDKR